MKKLAIFAEALTGGGVEKTLQTILKYWDYTNFDVSLYSIRNVPLPNCLSGLPIKHRFIFESCNHSKVGRIRVWLRSTSKLNSPDETNPHIYFFQTEECLHRFNKARWDEIRQQTTVFKTSYKINTINFQRDSYIGTVIFGMG